MKPDLAGLAGFFWIIVLGAALLVSAAGAYSKSRHVEEHAWGCDPFGYLRMAEEVRRAADRGEWPSYRLETPQSRLLIERMKSSGIPSTAWGEMVAPHAHHYFPRSDQVAVQYPPGTGLSLALFPRGEAVHGLCGAVIGTFVLVGLASLVVAGVRRAWAAAGGVVFMLQVGLDILGGLGAISFSVNAVLVPLLIGLALAVGADALRAVGRPRPAALAAFGAGLVLGFAMLVRLPVLFLIPGTALLMIGTSRRDAINSALLAFFLGFVLAGLVPLMAHQHDTTGSWRESTYGSDDSSPPSLGPLDRNFAFYFRGGAGAQYNWALPVTLAGFLALVLGTHSHASAIRVLLSAAVIWGLSTAYFLTHSIAIGYYQIPAVFAALVVLATGGFVRQALSLRQDEAARSGSLRVIVRLLALTAALLPGAVAIKEAWSARPRVSLSVKIDARQMAFPADLTDQRAWVFADLLTGPLWYYAEKPSYKVTFADARTRALAAHLAFERGEPLLVIRDCESMQGVMNELENLGGVLEPRGTVDRYPYYLVRWPPSGPRSDR